MKGDNIVEFPVTREARATKSLRDSIRRIEILMEELRQHDIMPKGSPRVKVVWKRKSEWTSVHNIVKYIPHSVEDVKNSVKWAQRFGFSTIYLYTIDGKPLT